MRTRFATCAAALFVAPGLIVAVLAQERGPEAPVSVIGKVFETELADLTLGATENIVRAINSATSINCIPQQKVTIEIITAQTGDAAFDRELGIIRKRTATEALRNAGVDPARYDLKLSEGSPDGAAIAIFERVEDRRPPSVEVTPRREKVNVGEQVRITIRARDDATQYDTGIQRIQLRDMTNGGVRVGGEYGEYGRIPNRCQGVSPPPPVPLTYTVPRNAPALIVLEAQADDKAVPANVSTAHVFLSTGDFAGRFEGKAVLIAAPGISHEETIDFDFALKADAQGNLVGNLFGRLILKVTNPDCPVTTLSQGSFQGELSGARLADGSYSIGTGNLEMNSPEVQYCSGGGRAPYAVIGPAGVISEAFRKLLPQKDGSLRSSSDAGGFFTYTLTMSRVVGK